VIEPSHGVLKQMVALGAQVAVALMAIMAEDVDHLGDGRSFASEIRGIPPFASGAILMRHGLRLSLSTRKPSGWAANQYELPLG
jgi:hypothetical protein